MRLEGTRIKRFYFIDGAFAGKEFPSEFFFADAQRGYHA
jgi:hypothetical protein